MEIPWPDNHCIGCGYAAELTVEHLLPQAVGGILTCRFLCKQCNSKFGEMEAWLKNDPGIWLAIESLKPQLPDLWDSISEGQKFITRDHNGRIKGQLKRGEFRINSQLLADGSLIQPSDDAKRTLRSMLTKAGRSPEEIKAVEIIDTLPEGIRIAGYVLDSPGHNL